MFDLDMSFQDGFRGTHFVKQCYDRFL